MNASLEIDLVVLLLVVGAMLLTVWLFRRFPMQSWFENRLAWLFPRDLVIAMETLAQAHPYRHMSFTFFGLLGVFTLFTDLKLVPGVSSLSPLVRYGTAACIAVFSLYTSRMNARRRAAQEGGGADVASP